MSVALNHAPRRAALTAAAFAGLLLAGCSSGHVGEDWQCPLAAGGSCTGVAAADPAVPKASSLPPPGSGQPIRLLPRESDTEAERTDAPPARWEPAPAFEPGGQAPMESRSCKADCGFDPFAWLARLFGTDTGGDNGQSTAASAVTPDVEEAPDRSAPDGDAEPSAAALPAETTRGEAASGDDGLSTADLRTGEIVARIWIAPFVDAGGVYREASHVRVVLEPAGWRLPR